MAVSTWIREVKKFPPSGVSWRWTDVVGHDDQKVKPRAAHAVRDLINRNDDGTYEIPPAFAEYLKRKHSVELEGTPVQSD